MFRKASPLRVLADPLVDHRPELGIVLAKRDGQTAAGAHGGVVVDREAGEHLAPELGQIVVHDRNRGKARVDHLENVIVFEHVGSLVDRHRGLAPCLQADVQFREAVVIDAVFSHEHRLAGQVVDRGDRRRARSGDHHFIHVGAGRLRESRNHLQFWPHRHHGRDHVDGAFQEGRPQHVARHRHHHHVQFEIAGLQLLVQIVLERLERLVGQPALLPLVDEVVGAVERHAHANRAALHHLVEVAGERLVE